MPEAITTPILTVNKGRRSDDDRDRWPTVLKKVDRASHLDYVDYMDPADH
jgi:hypothetical protein